MKNPEQVKIPKEELTEGVILSLKNSDRFFNDSKILFKEEKFSSANILMYFAIEEFSKAILLIDHFKGKKPVTNLEFKKYFGDHELKLGEFERYFEDTIPEMPMWAKRNNKFGRSEQIFKKRMMYVDWLQYKWHDPLFFEELLLSEEKDIPERMKGIFIVNKNKFIQSWNNLINDPIIEKIKTLPKIKKPTRLSVIKTAKPYLDPKRIPVSVKITQNKIELNLDVKLEQKLTIRKKLRKKLREEFSNYNIIINFEEKFLGETHS